MVAPIRAIWRAQRYYRPPQPAGQALETELGVKLFVRERQHHRLPRRDELISSFFARRSSTSAPVPSG